MFAPSSVSAAWFIAPLLLSTVTAASNDWNTPCLDGSCSYTTTVSGSASSGAGTLVITGHQDIVSDITFVRTQFFPDSRSILSAFISPRSAAGWTIWGCDPNSHAPQEIHLACTGTPQDCDHVFKGGAVNTIVRLPESCGAGPFARIAQAWQPEGATIPSHVLQGFHPGGSLAAGKG